MNSLGIVLMLLSCFPIFFRGIKYNYFIANIWTVDLYKEGINLQLKIFDSRVLPIVNSKEKSHLSFDEVIPYITGLFNLTFPKPEDKNAEINSNLVNVG